MERVKILKFYPYEVPYRRVGIVAYFDVILYGEILIRSVKLVRNAYGGLFVAMPTLQAGDKSIPIVEILSKELTEEIRRKLVDFYKERMEGIKENE